MNNLVLGSEGFLGKRLCSFLEERGENVIRIDTLLKNNGIDEKSYDFLNLDIQGVELRAMISCGSYLDNIKYIYTEVNSGEVYESNDLIENIDTFLSDRGFSRAETAMTEFEWGDAFYIKKDII